MLFRVLLLLTLASSLTHCRSPRPTESATPSSTAAPDAKAAAPPPRAPTVADLTRSEAEARARRLSHVRYNLRIQLNATDPTFSGENDITFDLADTRDDLRLDFFQGEVLSLKLNGAELDPAPLKSAIAIRLPAQALRVGENQLHVTYKATYTREGVGLHRFEDPVDKRIYIYSKLESFEANRVFPSFDQPDLRSIWNLTVEAPKGWTVIHTTRERAKSSPGKATTLWTFPTTPSIATYLVSLHAGPYKMWEDRADDIPLRLFARQSQAKYIPVKDFFRWTKAGLSFYQKYFGYPYPFKKYDQIFVPEAGGAMENVAAVTFTDSWLERGKPTRASLRSLAGVLLHEMAHMWFGDVVTMKWWNDLWLNESFATYMSALALNEATEFKESWQAFFSRSKERAYFEDALVTTHPIEARVESVRDGLANYDEITYGKGAAVVKQLRAYVGAEAFDAGIREYIKTHAFKNTELTDFIATLQKHTKKDLNVWANLWLRQTGADQIAATWTCERERLKRVDLKITPVAGQKFRPQTLTLALFASERGQLSPPVTLPVDMDQPEKKITGDWACPTFVYPNFEDHAYIRVVLDPQSLKFAARKLHGVDSPLLRNQLWFDLWEMVRNSQMPLKEYVDLLKTAFPAESDLLVLNKMFSTLFSSIRYWPIENETSRRARADFIAGMENFLLERLDRAAPGSDAQKLWFDQFSRVARTPVGLEQLKAFVNQKRKVRGLSLDVDRRWEMALTLARYQPQAAAAALARLKKEDPSDRGHKYEMAAEAVQPNPFMKQKWFPIVTALKPSLSVAELRAVASMLFPYEQAELQTPFEPAVYDYLRAASQTDNTQFLRVIARALPPLACETERSDRLKTFLAKEDLPLIASKPLRLALQEDERCQTVRAASGL